ncbi:fasciclin-like arabinogalactan protein 8 [Phragmites australis]|uniref:fasciclin-like arabinogalactan protein 8 n=1 Tax=Phragmites australis TaxID=29695 RepID=UPI002D7758ED|nr:fasciclin-like arabinogalactan protein 8 [Phragmites australis]
MAASHHQRHLILLVLFLAAATASAHNITAVLDGMPEYTLYNSYLSETKVCDEINSRSTVTCLVLTNGAMSSLVSNLSLADIKNALRLLTLLDYYDEKKLHSLHSGSELTTTLYQTTGDAAGNMGHVNITNLRGGKVAFASAAPGAKFQSTYTKRIKEEPYNLSVLEVSDPITFPGLFGSPSAASANLTGLLEKAGCKQFARLIVSSGVIKMYQVAMDKALTLFAPNDEAFKAKDLPDLNKLTSADLVALLQYHALPQYAPKASLKVAKGDIPTLASNGAGKYDLSVVSKGDDVSLDTGVDKSRVASTVLDDTPTVIHTVDSVLLPRELFGGAPSPAPGPGPVGDVPAAAPAPEASAPAPSPKAAGKKKKKAKSPSHSPPAPPADSPDVAPADAPAGDEADNADTKKNGATAAVMTFAATVASFALAVAPFL